MYNSVGSVYEYEVKRRSATIIDTRRYVQKTKGTEKRTENDENSYDD